MPQRVMRPHSAKVGEWAPYGMAYRMSAYSVVLQRIACRLFVGLVI